MSLLPGQIIPQSVPLGKVNADGTVTIEKDWWLLIYNLIINSVGTNLPVSALIELAELDADANDTDAIVLRRPISNLEKQIGIDPQISTADLPDIYKALLLAQDGILPDALHQAPPPAAIAPTGSPFTYTALSNGQVAVTGGTVSLIQIVRQGTTIATGLTTGLFVLARLDQFVVTYSVAPTLTFLPT